MEKIQLADSAKLLFIKNDRFKTTRITVNFYMPLEYDLYSETAMLPFFLTSCCKNHPTPALLSQHLNELYGSVLSATAEKLGDNRRIGFTVSALDDKFSIDGSRPMEETAKLLCDVIFQPSLEGGEFLDVDFQREKRLFCELVESEKNDKRQYARTRLESEMFKDSPYGLAELGSIESAQAITKQGLYAAWQKMLKEGNIGINVVGAVLPEKFVEDIKNRLAAIDRSPAELHYESEQLEPGRLTFAEDREEITQGKLCIGLTAPGGGNEAERAAMTMANDLLGGGTYSKLFTVVREQLHLCYYCAARISRQKGYMIIDSGVEPENAKKAQEEILRQLDEIKAGNFSDEDISSAKKSLCNAVKTAEDTASVLDRWYASRFLDAQPASPAQYRESINSVSRQDIIRAAGKIKPHTVYYMLPKEELK